MIVCGTVLIATPYIHNAIVMGQVTDTMATLNKTVNIQSNMPEHTDTACLLGGIIMIVFGGVASLKQKTNN